MTRRSPASGFGCIIGAGLRDGTDCLTGEIGRGSLKGLNGAPCKLAGCPKGRPVPARALSPDVGTRKPALVNKPILIISRRLSCAAMISRLFFCALIISLKRALETFSPKTFLYIALLLCGRNRCEDAREALRRFLDS